jgi:hypothetical protein
MLSINNLESEREAEVSKNMAKHKPLSELTTPNMSQ